MISEEAAEFVRLRIAIARLFLETAQLVTIVRSVAIAETEHDRLALLAEYNAKHTELFTKIGEMLDGK